MISTCFINRRVIGVKLPEKVDNNLLPYFPCGSVRAISIKIIRMSHTQYSNDAEVSAIAYAFLV